MTPPIAELVQIDLTPRRPERKPEWLKARAPGGETFHNLKKLARELNLHTVCESANCPNLGECWNQKSATFMMLGNLCTRRCGFCAVPKGKPAPIDLDEPRRVAYAVSTEMTTTWAQRARLRRWSARSARKPRDAGLRC
jgi:lipoic acid synthetase